MTERLYYRDCELLEFSARVIDVVAVGDRLAVVLDRTAFYPASGGQPFDTGTLGGEPVVDVVDAKETILHVLDGRAPAIGTEVVGRIDAERRLDHTQQHTGQHVLSQAFERTGAWRTVSFHLGAEYCTIDLDTPSLTDSQVTRVETLANQIVLDDRPIRIHFTTSDDLDRFGLRKPTERVGEVRIVEIDGFDRSACGGTHVRRTGQIGPIKVRRWERRGDETRVQFLCGWRALRDYSARLDTTRSLAERLSVGDSELLSATTRALDDLDHLRDELARLRDRLLDAEAADLIHASSGLPSIPTARLVARVFENRPPDDLKRLALAIVKQAPALVLLGSSGERSHLVFAQRAGLPFDVSSLLRSTISAIGGRGGGTRDLAQGGAPGGVSVEPAITAAVRVLSAEC